MKIKDLPPNTRKLVKYAEANSDDEPVYEEPEGYAGPSRRGAVLSSAAVFGGKYTIFPKDGRDGKVEIFVRDGDKDRIQMAKAGKTSIYRYVHFLYKLHATFLRLYTARSAFVKWRTTVESL